MLDYTKVKFLETWKEEDQEISIIFEFPQDEALKAIATFKNLWDEGMETFKKEVGEAYCLLDPWVGVNLSYFADGSDKQNMEMLFGFRINGEPRIILSYNLSPYVDYSSTDVISLLKIAFSATNA